MPGTSRKTRAFLSPSEQAVFDELVKSARDNDQIAARIGMTHRAAKFHMSNLLRKFGVTSREKLILLYWQERYRELQRQPRRTRGASGAPKKRTKKTPFR